MFLNNHNHKGSFRFFFPKRSKRARDRVIGDYLAAQKTLWHAWGNRTFEEFLSTAGAATPNSIQILLAVGAAELSPRAFRDVCRRIIDHVKILDETHNFVVPSWLDPNPLRPMLKDEDLLPFLRHCQKYKLCVSPLYNAAFEATFFLLCHSTTKS